MFDDHPVINTAGVQPNGDSATALTVRQPSEFPVDALSPVVRHLTQEVSQLYQIPPQMPAMAAMAVAGAAVGKRYKLVGAVNGLESFANLYVIAAAARGGGKGSVSNVVIEPLFEVERELRERLEPDRIRRESDAEILRAQIQALVRRAPRVPADQEADLRREIEDRKTRLEQIQPGGLPIPTPSLIMGNCTSEALAMALGTGDQAMLSYSAEAGELLRVVLGKYNKAHQGDVDLLLSGWSSEHVNYNRVGRGKLQLKPTLSLLWFVQPFILDELLANHEAGERGLTARMLIFDSKIEFKYDDGIQRAVCAEVREKWRGIVKHLTTFRPTTFSLEVCCSQEAREQFRAFYNQVIDLRKGAYADVEGEFSRWRENAIRIALNLWLLDDKGGELTGEQAARAIRLMTWCGFSYLEILERERSARKMARLGKLRELLLQTDQREMSLRDLETHHSFKKEEAQSLAAAFPASLQITKKPVGTQGGRPSEVIFIPAAGFTPMIA